MIDLLFNQFSECTFCSIRERKRSRKGQWTNLELEFKIESKLTIFTQLNVSALLILNKQYEILQIIVVEEGNISERYQFTQNEKKQLQNFYQATNMNPI